MVHVSPLKMPIRSFLGLYLLPGPKVFESNVKGSITSSSSTHNVTFVSSDNTNSTNEVDEFDLEEIYLKWKVAMISTRLKKFYKKTRKKQHFDAKGPIGFDKTKLDDVEYSPVNDRLAKVEGMHAVPPPMTGIYMPPKFDFEIDESKFTYGPKQSKTSKFDVKTNNLDSCESNFSVETLEYVPKPVESKPKAHVKTPRQTVKDQDTCSQNPKVPKRDWTGLMSKRLGLRYGYTRKACFVCGSFGHLIRDCDFHEKRMTKQVELNKSKNKVTCQRNDRPVWNNVQRLNHQNKFVPTAILTKTRRFPVNAAKQKFSSQATSTSTVRKFNTARPIVNEIIPRNNVYKSHSPIRSPFNRTPAPKAKFTNNKITTAGDKTVSAVGGNQETAVKTSAGCNWRSKRYYWNKDNPHQKKEKGVIDSGCSRHMTGNKAYLVEYQDFNGGPVSFGGSKGQITGKGKIRTKELDFEDVYFVKELQHFNLYYVSQMYDKKNKVLFTDTKCLVLSPDSKFFDENQVLLRVPRQNNMYSFNLENIVPSGGLACLIEKATVDESNKWHRRLGHVNIKNLNKLVKGNLVRGLPSKIFQNDHTCVACHKGKQHKASWIKREYSNAITPQQNRVAERKNKTLIEAVRTMLAESFLPNTFWAKSVSTACYVLNRPVTVENKANITAGPKEANTSAEAKNEAERLKRQEKEADDAAETLRKTFAKINTASIPVPVHTTSPSRNVSAAGPSYLDLSTNDNQDDSQILSLEDIYEVPSDGIFTSASYDDEGVVADFINLESTVNVSPIPQSRIHSIHPTTQILRDPTLAVQTKSKVNKSSGAHAFEELLQFKTQQVWILVGLRFGKKVPRAWYATLSTFLVQSGYRRGLIDKIMFIKKDKKDIMLVQVYVDDIIFGSTKKSWCDEFEALIKSMFQMSSMGELTFFLGLQTASTPIKTQKPLVRDAEATDVDVHPYRSMIDSLMYLTASRPNIMYLKGQPKLGLWYLRELAFDQEAYSDSDYA
nr:ribonuclease H-like domain-containing protein [Tanacetum cinerariifolium]